MRTKRNLRIPVVYSENPQLYLKLYKRLYQRVRRKDDAFRLAELERQKGYRLRRTRAQKLRIVRVTRAWRDLPGQREKLNEQLKRLRRRLRAAGACAFCKRRPRYARMQRVARAVPTKDGFRQVQVWWCGKC